MILPIYQIDAFSRRVFGGNPAAVCILKDPIPETLLQKIANENNLAETAFVWPQGDQYSIRWFTPTVEVDLCGHATLASAYVLYELLQMPQEELIFHSRSGPLKVSRKADGLYELDFPVDLLEPCKIPSTLVESLNAEVLECYKGKTDILCTILDETTLLHLKPHMEGIRSLGGRGVIVTAPGDQVDFVSRCFFPQSGIDEDPVTGSAHTSLAAYWAHRLKKHNFTAKQLSARGGDLYITLEGDRVLISGYAAFYMEGKIYLPE
jgi:PhzF family phenazine biosynthesis protein